MIARVPDALIVDALKDQYQAALRDNRVAPKRLQGRPPAPPYVADTARHVADTARRLKRFAAEHGAAATSEVTRQHVRMFLDKHAGPASVHRRAHGALHRMYRWAIERDLVACADQTGGIEALTHAPRERALSVSR